MLYRSGVDDLKWSYTNDNQTNCLCSSWKLYFSHSETVQGNVILEVPINCVPMTDPPPGSLALSFLPNSSDLPGNTPSSPWTYWLPVMSDSTGSLQTSISGAPPKFCIPTYTGPSRLVSPANNSQVIGDSSGVTVQFKWNDPIDWGYGCDTDSHVFLLRTALGNASDFSNWPSSGSTTEKSMNLTFNPASDTTVRWKVRAGLNFWTPTTPEIIRLCLVTGPVIVWNRYPTSGTQHYEDPIVVGWTYNDSSFGKNCGISVSNFYFQVMLGTESSNPALFATLPSAARSVNVPRNNFTVGETGVTVFWRVKVFGPLGKSVVSTVTRNFTICDMLRPAAPTGLQLSCGTTLVCSGSSATFSATWNNPTTWGSHCTPPAFQRLFTMLVYQSGGAPNSTASTTAFTLEGSVACTNQTVTVRVFTDNGNQYCLSPAMYTFTICKKIAPNVPAMTAPSSPVIMPLATTTNLTWSPPTWWGVSCNSSTAKGFILSYRGPGSSFWTDIDIASASTTTTTITTATVGTWSVKIRAYNGNMFSTDSAIYNWTVCQLSAPQPTTLVSPASGASMTNFTFTFTWGDPDNWGTTCGLTANNTFTWYLDYPNGTTHTMRRFTPATHQTVIVLPDVSASWKWYVVTANALPMMTTSTSTKRTLNQNMVCEIIYPSWPDPWAVLPAWNFSQTTDLVVFDWNSVVEFGTTCKTPDFTWYRLWVDAGNYNTTSMVTTYSLPLSAGPHSWYVEAWDNNVSTATAPRTFNFCLINPPPAPTPTCAPATYIFPFSLSWASGLWPPTCGAATSYQVSITEFDGSPVATLPVPTTSLTVAVPTNIPDGNYSWTLTARASTHETPSNTTCHSVIICTPKQPNTVALGPTTLFLTTALTLRWTVDTVNEESTRCSQAVSRECNVTVTTPAGTVVYTTLVPYSGAQQMNRTVTLAEGQYTWSVNIWNGFKWSGFPSPVAFTVCVPQSVPYITLVSPANGSKPLKQGLQLVWATLPNPQSCDKTTAYSLLLGPPSALEFYDALETSMTTLSPTGLVDNQQYCWAINVDTGYQSRTSDTECFIACVPSAPQAAVLLTPDPEALQPAILTSSANLSWALPGTGETCDLGADITFTVLLGTTTVLDEDDSIATTVATKVTAKNLNNGVHYWQVLATNNAGLTSRSPLRNFTVCLAMPPPRPQLMTPAMGARVRLADEPFVEIASPDSFGRTCLNMSQAQAGFRLFLGPDASALGAPLHLPLSTPRASAHNGIKVIRWTNVSLSYGPMFYTATITNSDGLETVTDLINVFIVCDTPIGVNLVGPADGSTGVARTLTLQWGAATLDVFGYPCTDTPGLQQVRIYIDEIPANVTNATLFVPTTLAHRMSASGNPDRRVVTLGLNTTFAWRVGIYNGYEETFTTTWRLTTVERDCSAVTCLNAGSCDPTTLACLCVDGWRGADCSEKIPKNYTGAILGGLIGGLALAGLVGAAIALFFIRRRKKQMRMRIRLKAPGGDLRFSFVKTPSPMPSGRELDDAEDRIKADAESGFEYALAVVAATQNTELENTCKALLYAYERHKLGLPLLKALISNEVEACKSASVIFRSNTAATLMFKHHSKMVGLTYLFGIFHDLIESLLQKEVDQTLTEQDIAENKKFTELMTIHDTCEVDPTKLTEEMRQEDVLAINSLQLSLVTQRFIAHIFRSIADLPPELRDISRHLKATVEAKYPEAIVRSLGAFIFLRFFNCAISIPEAYGLTEDAPPEKVRRSLVLVTKVLQTLSSGVHFGEKEAFMTQFNELLDTNKPHLDAYYDALITVPEGTKFIPVEIPEKLYTDSLAVIAKTRNLSERRMKHPEFVASSSAPPPPPPLTADEMTPPPPPPPEVEETAPLKDTVQATPRKDKDKDV